MLKLITITYALLMLLFGFIPTIGVSIASIIIGVQNLRSENSCSNSVMEVPIWLIVYGSVSIGLLILGLLTGILCVILRYCAKIRTIIPVMIIYLIYYCFNIAWIVIGGIILIKNGEPCRENDYSLWAMGIAAWAVQLFNIVFFGCSASYVGQYIRDERYRKRNKSNPNPEIVSKN